MRQACPGPRWHNATWRRLARAGVTWLAGLARFGVAGVAAAVVVGAAMATVAAALPAQLGRETAAVATGGPLAKPPFSDPSSNRQPPVLSISTGGCKPGLGPAGQLNCPSPCYPHYHYQSHPHFTPAFNNSAACLHLLMSAINAAQRAEHLQPLVLPSNFRSLSVPQQLFVLTNLERLSRGVPAIVGLSPYLDRAAMASARQAVDPPINAFYGPVQVLPLGGGVYAAGGVWFGNMVDSAAAMFGWMYDDGWGGSLQNTSNEECHSPSDLDCWGHRNELLGSTTGPACADCVAGAGFASPAQHGMTVSYTLLLVVAHAES